MASLFDYLISTTPVTTTDGQATISFKDWLYMGMPEITVEDLNRDHTDPYDFYRTAHAEYFALDNLSKESQAKAAKELQQKYQKRLLVILLIAVAVIAFYYFKFIRK